jgi:hypothetical protein
MKEYVVEIVLGVVLLGVFLALSAWQSAKKLSPDEVDHYIQILEEKLPPEMEDRTEFLSRLHAWAGNDDGQPIFILNLMRFFDQLESFPGGPTSGTPEEANAYYEEVVAPLVLKNGGYPIVAGATTGIRGGQQSESNLMVFQGGLDGWDRVLVIRYPGRRAFFELVSSPEFLQVMPYKLASLQLVLTPFYGEMVIPDLRLVVGGGGLAIFLLIGWIRAARRSARQRKSGEHTP